MFEYVYNLFIVVCNFFAIYFGLISLCCLCGKKKEKQVTAQLKFAVLIPARNEQDCIHKSIESLKQQEYPSELLDIYVVPNNCTDYTAERAVEAGANIITVPSTVKNKGKALHFAMAHLQNKYDAFVVFDADNEMNPKFMKAMNQTLGNGYRVAKSRIMAKNRKDAPIATCYDIHFCTANQFLNRARVRIGLSARIIGTGFAVKTEFLKEIGGFNTQTITEDAEFFAICGMKGEQVGFCEDAIAYDEQPIDFKTSLIQRKRWMSGIMQVLSYKWNELKQALYDKKSSVYTLDVILQFMFCYVQAMIPFAVIILFLSSPDTFVESAFSMAVKGYSSILSVSVLVLALERRLTLSKNIILGILIYPLFVLSFIPLQTISLFKKTTHWKPIKHTGSSDECIESKYKIA